MEIPYQPWAAARKKENQEHWMDRDPEIKCFQPGVPRAMYMPHPFQIIQSATKIQMIFEFANAQRTIHLNKMEPYPNVLWMGYSVGPLGGRHAGGRRLRFHGCDVVRPVREFP